MSLPRFLHPGPLAANTIIDLPEALAHHAVRVLRLKPDAAIVLFDGRGGQYPARLIIDGKRASAELGAHDPVEAELAGHITLVQGIAAGDKMDWIIEKAVELGANEVAPIFAQRSVLQLSGERLRKRLEHWRRVASAATEQCGRNRLPVIQAPATLHDYLTQRTPASTPTLFCHPGAARTLPQALDGVQRSLALMVGPEGGWSDEELALAQAHQLTPVSFGRSVLRTETAGLALIAASSALLGWA
ncbi:16S rRNA (uracil(1498)-N(3))-methyltransferase [Pusillimonas sp. TS35]|uniref:16S rRNA (uracil(1498)-N(3))-methyltransferase n=1 Tax=Paracandidimonas lactea TaxID=2895524 RepID=UPI001369A070|nr:16S rRNA (uracil(1498)-N(3))-methyltransferase [Paracandidimonas lactea]MYN13195.1 16S rRNA (uracil(1498)-N(3))-methyltransferase [Pusillimonas sp. TS35]